eukprot:TRINITY_DN5965_c0_g1_i1.p1 TRINITY_DN5965_c0_g1~~TRINITY_DN5965_c0_g1_i1.p1  ORF type:complete len:274 (-),score=28.90 TRINITY_DN5965_c0_g1_i1:212-1033(-)
MDDDRNSLLAVVETCRRTAETSTHVKINNEALQKVAQRIASAPFRQVAWNFDQVHFFDGGPLTVQYLLVVDCLNFCFWPDPDLHYEHLAKGLKRTLEEDPEALSAAKLSTCTGMQLRTLLRWPRPLPLEEERARLLRELSAGLMAEFRGSAVNLVKAANGSAARLVYLLTAHFPGFRDHCIYKGRQVFLYKRAQIFVGDLWGAFQGEGFGAFTDIERITMFADYLVPAVLRDWGILTYSTSLAETVEAKVEVCPGNVGFPVMSLFGGVIEVVV